MFSLQDVIQIAIQLENNGEAVYRRAAEKSNQASLCSFMAWMADQEAAHAQWFGQLKISNTALDGDRDLARMGRELLQDAVGEQSFSLESLDLNRVEDLNELIRVSIEFEKDTVLFYEMLSAFVDTPDGRSLLEKIIVEEHRHIRMLEEFIGN